jgi:D-serine deaminase-like pyridoxal phosphate-dependent protein
MDVPAAATVREWNLNNVGDAFDFARYGYPEPEIGDPDHLDGRVLRVVAWIEIMVGRKLDASLTDPGLVALAQDAVLMRLQQVLVGRGTTKAVRDALADSKIKTLRAGDYGQTNRDAVDARKAMQVNAWDELSDTLLALATPERRAELLAELSGKVRPIGLVVDQPRGYAGDSYPADY